MSSQFRVGIIGGGTGGLCLAQALHKAGVPVAVYERSGVRTDRLQGYRVHINPKGSRALHECLPADQWQAFVETCGSAGRRVRVRHRTVEGAVAGRGRPHLGRRA